MSKNTVEMPVQERREQEQGTIAVSSGGAAAQNNLRNIGLIIGREYKNRVTQRSFIITSVILLVIVFLAAFIPTIVQLITAGPTSPTSQTHIVVVNDAGSVAGLTDMQLAATIGTVLNGTAGTQTAGPPAFALSFSPAHALPNLQQQVKSGQLDILLVLDRAPNQDVRFTYYTTNSSTNDPNLSTVQALTQAAHLSGYRSSPGPHLARDPAPGRCT